MKTSTKPARWAFWQYDLFPYILSGRVLSGTLDGCEIEGYGKGYRHKPLAIISGDKGEQLAKDLDALRTEHRAANQALDAGFAARVKALVPFAAKVKYLG